MLSIVAKLKAKPGKGDELAAQMSLISKRVEADEPGNHGYTVHQAAEDADLVMIYETYDDQDALNAHRAHMKEMKVDLSELLAGRPELEYYNVKA